MPSHSHDTTLIYPYSGNTYVYTVNKNGTNTSQDTHISTANTGGSSSHIHSLSGTATIALNVKYTDIIICSKN